jgi:hypothetical protein
MLHCRQPSSRRRGLVGFWVRALPSWCLMHAKLLGHKPGHARTACRCGWAPGGGFCAPLVLHLSHTVAGAQVRAGMSLPPPAHTPRISGCNSPQRAAPQSAEHRSSSIGQHVASCPLLVPSSGVQVAQDSPGANRYAAERQGQQRRQGTRFYSRHGLVQRPQAR